MVKQLPNRYFDRNECEEGMNNMGYNQQRCGCRKCNNDKESCVSGMSDALRYFENRKVLLFEDSGNIVLGRVNEVRDGVIRLENSVKFLVNPIIGGEDGILYFERLYISICKIEEFAPESAMAVPESQSGGMIERLIKQVEESGVCSGEPWNK
ncbi:hypothetical protein CIL05_05395 [Virgibacillus profundi]|uniref:Uncharacterized protein n=1 Tax=Virgibacillus profundi TaxID=2024555 RepID=A0A2A2IGU2_9BACI|nr:hypothetical protein [Virgibacillus profundi]PAV30536.1 hypothetical protein CIL05_05395 [Virgibacillus profundi]PXY54708.1 hypothetical protein CIT14_05480 [Virgibacillus profundi]